MRLVIFIVVFFGFSLTFSEGGLGIGGGPALSNFSSPSANSFSNYSSLELTHKYIKSKDINEYLQRKNKFRSTLPKSIQDKIHISINLEKVIGDTLINKNISEISFDRNIILGAKDKESISNFIDFGDDLYTNGSPTITSPKAHTDIIKNSIKQKKTKGLALSGFEKKKEQKAYSSEYSQSYSGVGMMVGKKGLIRNLDSSYSLHLKDFKVDVDGNELKLCESENKSFEKKHVEDAYCSGFLTNFNKKQIFVTARHCTEVENDKELINSKIVFGYQYDEDEKFFNRLDESSIYRVSSILDYGGRDNSYDKTEDFVFLKLDRKVSEKVAKPFVLDIDGKRSVGEMVVLVGHPQGFSQKIDFDLDKKEPKIENIVGNQLLVSTDSHHKNSGSPILSTISGNVIGILVSGLDDFKKCNVDGADCACSHSGLVENTKEIAIDVKSIPFDKLSLDY